MSIKKNIGGDRLGSGAKMNVDLKTYNRSTHDLGYIWRSTMSAGTLVPFIKEVALPGDTFDIDLDVDVKTHPTIGPLFGSYKVQLDLFQVPARLYQSALHNNAIGIGMRMKDIKLPMIKVPTPQRPTGTGGNLTQAHVESLANHPSSLLAHLDIVGTQIALDNLQYRNFNAIPYLGYWDIYKNYYANKQEEVGMFINRKSPSVFTVFGTSSTGSSQIPQEPNNAPTPIPFNELLDLTVTFGSPQEQEALKTIHLGIDIGGTDPSYAGTKITDIFQKITQLSSIQWLLEEPKEIVSTDPIVNWAQIFTIEDYIPTIDDFPLENIDDMREAILSSGKYEQFLIDTNSPIPYSSQLTRVFNLDNSQTATQDYVISQFNQQGLALKTYQADLFNNWMSTEWVDNATTGINAITAVDTTEGNFTIDALNLAQKVYDMLNRIAISGGTYDDWLETVYTHEYINRAESPVYIGGLSKELVFQEVVSVSESASGQPLGTLAGKGVMSNKHKGGSVISKHDEIGYIMGIVSITPRIDYSQGNKWDVNLQTMDDFHKPALDEIGFQDLITDQMAWWTTKSTSGVNTYQSAGKQPAWINYMTNVNKVRGNFALQNNEMFMTLNRRYEFREGSSLTYLISDLTTYIDPSKFNFIFADTSLDSQNFWVQIGVDIKARRKMSAKIMPNL